MCRSLIIQIRIHTPLTTPVDPVAALLLDNALGAFASPSAMDVYAGYAVPEASTILQLLTGAVVLTLLQRARRRG